MWFRDQARAAAAVFAELDAASVDPVLSSEHAAYAERLVAAQDRHRQLSASVAHLRSIVSKEDADSKVRVVVKQRWGVQSIFRSAAVGVVAGSSSGSIWYYPCMMLVPYT